MTRLGRYALIALLAAGGTGTATATGTIGSGGDLIRALRARAIDPSRGFTLRFTIASPVSVRNPALGSMTRRGRLTVRPGERGFMLQEPSFDTPVQYWPPGWPGFEPMDYDDEDRLIVWRPSADYGLQAKDMNAWLAVQTGTVVIPGDTIVSRDPWSCLRRYAPGDDESMTECDRILLALTASFGEDLDSAAAITHDVAADGLTEVNAVGAYGRALHGMWRLAIDTAGTTIMVRHAEFTADGDELPYIALTTYGAQSAGDAVLPERATAVFFPGQTGELPAEIVFEQFEPVADQALLDTLRARITAPLPKGSDVMDYRYGYDDVQRVTVH